MKETVKTSILVGFVFMLSFGLLYSYIVLYNSGYLIRYPIKEKQLQITDNVFLLGSSYTGRIDTMFIENYLKMHDISVNVYHPTNAIPSNVLSVVNDIVRTNPKLVMIGIGFTDLGVEGHDCNFVDNIPPISTKSVNTENESSKKERNSQMVTNPRQITIEFLRHYVDGRNKDIEILVDRDRNIEIPLETLDGHRRDDIVDINILNSALLDNHCLDYQKRDNESYTLRIIIQKFKEKNISVILFVPPFTKAYLHSIPDNIESHVVDTIRQTAKDYDIEFYDLSGKYESADIFSDVTHVAYNSKATDYSKDIGEIILKKAYN